MSRMEDTIAAIATPPGEGAIGIIRLSGEETLRILGEIFVTSKGKRLEAPLSHKLYYGYILDPVKRAKIDEVMLAYMKGPHSYTREDMAEIFCHGGTLVMKSILELVINSGARLAKPGEFTLRAFLNGRIDLTQAEGVNDLIRAKNEASLKMALGILEGRLSKEIKGLRDELMGILAQVEVSLDFAEEDLELLSQEVLLARLEAVIRRIEQIIESYDRGRSVREGISLVITGRPNVGKSTLMNAILEENRAIVTPIPGTTRDVLSEQLEISGIPVRIKDTAGLVEDTTDPVEAEGVRRTWEELRKANIILLVLDGSQPLDTLPERTILENSRDKELLVIINKIDLPQVITEAELRNHFHQREIIRVSAKQGEGLPILRRRLAELVQTKDPSGEGPVLTRLRHKEGLLRVKRHLLLVKENMEASLPEEIWSIDLREAIVGLGEIVGENYTPDLLERIFSEFCIGK